MDTAAINQRGIAPLKDELDRIGGMASEEDVVGEIIRLHRMGIPVLFIFGAQPDAKDSMKTIASLGQGGLSLPDRDFYLKNDPKSVETRQRFQQHVTKMFELAGDAAAAAAAKAQAVMDFETDPGQGFGGPCLHARSQQALPSHDEEGPGRAGSDVSAGMSTSRIPARRRLKP